LKKNFLVAIMFVALHIISASVFVAVAQEPPMAGAYSEAYVTEREVVAAARFAVRTEQRKQGGRLSLLSVERAEKQVVAGLNYRLCLKIRVNGKAQEVKVVVYKNLKQRYSLSSWEAGECRNRE
jgi:hypothetical protein